MPGSLNAVLIIIIFIIPGFVCERAFSLSIPRARKETTYVILESIFLSCLNYALLSWTIVLMYSYKMYESHQVWFAVICFCILFVAPIITGVLLANLVRSHKFRRFQRWLGLISPIPKAWGLSLQ